MIDYRKRFLTLATSRTFLMASLTVFATIAALVFETDVDSTLWEQRIDVWLNVAPALSGGLGTVLFGHIWKRAGTL